MKSTTVTTYTFEEGDILLGVGTNVVAIRSHIHDTWNVSGVAQAASDEWAADHLDLGSMEFFANRILHEQEKK